MFPYDDLLTLFGFFLTVKIIKKKTDWKLTHNFFAVKEFKGAVGSFFFFVGFRAMFADEA